MMENRERFYKIDIHTHSFVSYDYGKYNANSSNINNIDDFIKQVKDKEGVLPDIMSFTDHGVFSKELYERLVGEFENKIFFPGLEVNTYFDEGDSKFHAVILINPKSLDKFIEKFPEIAKKSEKIINDEESFFTNVNPEELVSATKRVKTKNLRFKYNTLVRNLYDCEIDFILIPHFHNKSNGMRKPLSKEVIKNVINHSENIITRLMTNALDDNLEYRENFKTQGKLNRVIPTIFNLSSATIYSTDNHDLEEYPFTAVDNDGNKTKKIDTFVYCNGTFESFKQSLMYPETKVYYKGSDNEIIDDLDDIIKDEEDRERIKSATFGGEEIIFSKNNNIIIGPKGSGKSYIWTSILKNHIDSVGGFEKYKNIKGDFTNFTNNLDQVKPERYAYIPQEKISKININKVDDLVKIFKDEHFNIEIKPKSLTPSVIEAKNRIEDTESNYRKLRTDLSNISNISNELIDSLKNLKSKSDFKRNQLNSTLVLFDDVIDKLIQEAERDRYNFTEFKDKYSNNEFDLRFKFNINNAIFKEEMNNVGDKIDNINKKKELIIKDIELIDLKTRKFAKFAKIMKSNITIKSSDDSKDPSIVFNEIFKKVKIANLYNEYEKYLQTDLKNDIKVINEYNKSITDGKSERLIWAEEIYLMNNIEDIIRENLDKAVPDKKTNKFTGNIKSWICKIMISEENDLINKNPSTFTKINLNKISKMFSFINGEYKDFDEISPGQKMEIFMNHLFNEFFKSKKVIFIDQPEDNLDNETINKVIAKYIREQRYKKQFFIVTHNSQVLFNSDPDIILIPEINNDELSLTHGSLFERKIFSKAIKYIEGGVSSMNSRFAKMSSGQPKDDLNSQRLEEILQKRYNLKLENIDNFNSKEEIFNKIKDEFTVEDE